MVNNSTSCWFDQGMWLLLKQYLVYATDGSKCYVNVWEMCKMEIVAIMQCTDVNLKDKIKIGQRKCDLNCVQVEFMCNSTCHNSSTHYTPTRMHVTRIPLRWLVIGVNNRC